MNTNTNNEVDYKMTPPPLPIIPKKKSKRQPRVLDDNDEPQQPIKTPKLPKGTKAKTEIENEVITEQINDIIAECLAEVKAETQEDINKSIYDIYSKVSLTIGEELPSEVLEAEVLPVKFADASCQTDDLLENEIVCSKCCAPKLDRKEYHRQYNEKNKQKISEYKKKYRQENKDKINTDAKREYQRKYDAEHKAQIMARRNIILKCECGEEVKASSLGKHKKTKTHLLKVELRIAKGEIVIPVEAELDADDNA